MEARKELKKRARENLKRYLGPSVLVCILGTILGTDTGLGVSAPSGVTFRNSSSQINHLLRGIDVQTLVFVLMAILGVLVTGIILSVMWKCLVGNVAQIGLCRYFLKSRELGKSAGLKTLISGFTLDLYGNIVKTMFFRNLFITLWGFLLVIPGVVKSYEYAMVPYLLAENPQMECREALAASKEMMDGNKWKLFVFHLSFAGWIFLGALPFGIGLLFVIPYMYAAETEFYVSLRDHAQEASSLTE